MPMPDVPDDIWAHIASFIEPSELQDLFGVNSVFLNLAFNERYSDVRLVNADGRTIAFLQRLCDPFVAQRVHYLRINPIFFKNPPRPRWKPVSGNAMRRLYGGIRNRLIPTPQTEANDSASAEKSIFKLATQAVANLDHVTTYSLVARSLPISPEHRTFFSSTTEKFCPHLCKFVLTSSLAGIECLLPPPGCLPSLEILDFRLINDHTVDSDRDETIMSEIVGPFINGASPSLRQLGISSASTKDHSSLFRPLGKFPKLQSISLNIGFCPPLLIDQSVLTRFLLNHADTLERLELQPIESYHPPSGPQLAYMHFVAWMGQISTEVRLNHLKRLTIAPPPALCDVTTVDIATPLLLSCKNTLTHLVLRNCYRPFSEVKHLLDLLAYLPGHPGLQSLHLKALSLSPQLFDYASIKLPNLDDFNVHFDTLLPHADMEYTVIPASQSMEAVDIAPFVQAMKPCRYPDWKLHSLWIFQRSRMTTAMAYDILCLLKECIPSVESFLGTSFKMVVPAILPSGSE